MTRSLKAVGLAALGSAALLLPLYGDPHASPVTQAEWARMLVRAFDLEDALPPAAPASLAFSVLSWKNSLAYRADQYLEATGLTVQNRGGQKELAALSGTGEASYQIAVVRGGNYLLRVHLSGNPAQPAAAEIRRVGEIKPAATFRIGTSSVPSWSDAGATHLDPGVYTASFQLPAGSRLEQFEVAPPCLNAVEPPGGWQATTILQDGDLAVTVLKALDRESELPAAATAIEVHGANFLSSPSSLSVSADPSALASQGLWLKAGTQARQAVALVDIPEAGLYAVSAFGVEGGGQRWLTDSCQKAVVCGGQPGVATQEVRPGWRALMTTELTAGRHSFEVSLAPGSAVERLRVERKKDSPADYRAAVERLGLDLGPAGPVSRATANAAMNFVRQRRSELGQSPCGDVVPTPTLAVSAKLAEPAPLPRPLGPPAPPAPPGAGPLAPPVLPPQLPASPVLP